MYDVGQAAQETNAIQEEIDHDILKAVNDAAKRIEEAEKSAKAVWEIDGTTVYVRDITIHKCKEMSVDWFTFNESVDKKELGVKVETLAKTLLKEETKCTSRNPFSKIFYSIRNIFG
ncbi:MAG: hypothetical protein ACRCWQ_04460 [Bacilli bacterium]